MKKKIDIEIIDKKQIPQSEPERQYYFMDIAKIMWNSSLQKRAVR